MRRLGLVMLAAVLVLAGCSDTGRQGREGGGKTGGKRPATVAGIPTSTGTHKQKLDVDTPGHREYLIHVPPKLTKGGWRGGRPAERLPVVIALHGGLSNMDGMRKLTGFDALADDKGFLAVYPDGFMTTWNAGDCCGPAKAGKIKDVDFLSRLIDRLTDAGLADPRRVYVTGFSNGAGMAYRVACEAAGRVAAIGVVEGALVTPCSPERPVSAMIFHGTADRNVPFHGGGERDFNDKRPFPPVSRAVDFWRKKAGLPEPRRNVRALGADGAECSATGKGAAGAEVVFCRIEGGTHRWPDGASEALWSFFAAHPAPRQ
ncbi:alpha/beta hydrolase family esterase [Actinomadura kijaniata]|uniref:alpha/beta hydrolase family esterase n=1 Tax=Actinomadura kijaniata TaxID=46161 RepID=UPI00082A6B71|nr:PHB depolymerase family esterase [Actinomadura kijaniata]